MMSNNTAWNRRELGRDAEAAACDYLTARGVTVIFKNFRCRTGELDLIAQHGKLLVIVEVRLRTRGRRAGAAASVGPGKQARIIAATRYFLLTRPQFRRFAVRFDVIALDRSEPQAAAAVEWIQNAFEVRS